MLRSTLALTLACCFLTAACASEGEQVVASAQPIAGGQADPADSAVVAFYYLAGGSLCTGTLIAPNVVLTARHCVSPTLDTAVGGGVSCIKTRFGDPGAPVSFLVTTSPKITIGNAGEYLVQEIVLLPVENDSFCGNDVAILILKSNIAGSTATPYLPRVDAPLAAGEVYSAVGFGATDDDGTGAGTRRRRDDLVVSCVADACGTSMVEATEWTGDTGVCHGDSGGPALDAQNRVIGVTSRGKVGCDEPVYGDVYSWRQWLKDTVAYASGLGAYPPPAWTEGATVDPEHSMPVGEPCESAKACFNGNCHDDGVERYCSRACDAAAVCPEGFECAGDPGVCQTPGRDIPKEAPAVEAESGCGIGPGAGGGYGALGCAAALIALACRRRRARA